MIGFYCEKTLGNESFMGLKTTRKLHLSIDVINFIKKYTSIFKI